MELLENISSTLWGPASLLAVLLCALYLGARCGFFHILHPIKTLSALRTNGGQKGALSNMLTALGGSIGVGNITGVSVAIAKGGAGAIFWMWMCAILGMTLKFSEIVLAVRHKKNGLGGAMFYLEKSMRTRALSFAFCICCVVSSFGIGCTVQSNACAQSVSTVGIPPLAVGLILAAFVSVAVFGSAKRLIKISSAVVPVMGIAYVLAALAVIFVNKENLPMVFKEIFEGALGKDQLVGGVCGFAISSALRHGISKGIFSSECGMGSSCMTYAAENDNPPEKQGVWGMLEVGIDTLLMCTLTALSILSSSSGHGVAEAFQRIFGNACMYLIGIFLFFFAFTSICSWNFYAKSSIRYMTKSKTVLFIYNTVFIFAVVIGAVSDIGILWEVSDIFNFFMLAVNLLGLVTRGHEISQVAKLIVNRKALK